MEHAMLSLQIYREIDNEFFEAEIAFTCRSTGASRVLVVQGQFYPQGYPPHIDNAYWLDTREHATEVAAQHYDTILKMLMTP